MMLVMLVAPASYCEPGLILTVLSLHSDDGDDAHVDRREFLYLLFLYFLTVLCASLHVEYSKGRLYKYID